MCVQRKCKHNDDIKFSSPNDDPIKCYHIDDVPNNPIRILDQQKANISQELK